MDLKISRNFNKKSRLRKEKSRFGWIAAKAYKKYPNLVNTMLNRYEVYNETLHYIEKEEQAGNLFVIRPEVPLQVDRMEKIQQNYKIYMSKAMKMQRDSLQI